MIITMFIFSTYNTSPMFRMIKIVGLDHDKDGNNRREKIDEYMKVQNCIPLLLLILFLYIYYTGPKIRISQLIDCLVEKGVISRPNFRISLLIHSLLEKGVILSSTGIMESMKESESHNQYRRIGQITTKCAELNIKIDKVVKWFDSLQTMWADGKNIDILDNGKDHGTCIIKSTHVDRLDVVDRNTAPLEQINTNGNPFEIFFRHILWYPTGSEDEALQTNENVRINKNYLSNSLWMITADMYSQVVGRTVTVDELRYSVLHSSACRMIICIPCFDGSYLQDKGQDSNGFYWPK